MKLHITLLASALMLALPALAKEVPMNQAAAIANGVTPAAASPAFDALESQSLSQLRNALKDDAATLTRDQLEHARQNKTQADTAWLIKRLLIIKQCAILPILQQKHTRNTSHWIYLSTFSF